MNISENAHIVSAIAPQAGGSAIVGSYINLKNATHVTIMVHVNQANAAPVALTIEQAKAVAGTGSKAITEPVQIYLVDDAAMRAQMGQAGVALAARMFSPQSAAREVAQQLANTRNTQITPT